MVGVFDVALQRTRQSHADAVNVKSGGGARAAKQARSVPRVRARMSDVKAGDRMDAAALGVSSRRLGGFRA